jgi:hypothetical protein
MSTFSFALAQGGPLPFRRVHPRTAMPFPCKYIPLCAFSPTFYFPGRGCEGKVTNAGNTTNPRWARASYLPQKRHSKNLALLSSYEGSCSGPISVAVWYIMMQVCPLVTESLIVSAFPETSSNKLLFLARHDGTKRSQSSLHLLWCLPARNRVRGDINFRSQFINSDSSEF